MQSKAKTVTEYMKEVPVEHLDALTELREICMQSLKGFKEVMEYGYPGYSRNGSTEIGWQSQKNGISLFIKEETILKNFKSKHKSLDISRNNVHFKDPNKLPLPILTELIKSVANSKQTPFV